MHEGFSWGQPARRQRAMGRDAAGSKHDGSHHDAAEALVSSKKRQSNRKRRGSGREN